ncbi:MAG: cobalt-precorrin-3B C(17)-methyltransferase [Methanobrevibacter sp.]|jgi:precorrin-3B C17-methyltransferase|nr:cobalt-precorrin-3B C(17)-methyltransferase [Candidatus Methanoflexus mossambicus]
MLNVIGIGQNNENISISAINAIKESDVIVGYKKYIESIEHLIEGKEIIKKGMGDEIKRVELAIEKAIEGKTVSLISSGDPGIFGMANVLFQILPKYNDINNYNYSNNCNVIKDNGINSNGINNNKIKDAIDNDNKVNDGYNDENNLNIKIYPGVTAANYAASLTGAPLHDFAAISLSDILTPLNEIERKIKYAAIADLVLVIYNPISKTRKEPFRLFKRVLLENINPNTFISIVDSSHYPSKVTITRLKNLDEKNVNMSSTLIVGNSMTYIENINFNGENNSNNINKNNGKNYLITPRGYVVKSNIHPMAKAFYDRFLDVNTNNTYIGANKTCQYYPCHDMNNQQCDFCFCPFYPCADGSTGGKWIKNSKNESIWSCEDCSWVHEENTVKCIKNKIYNILTEVENLKSNKKELLKLRRECIYNTRRKIIVRNIE